MKIKLNSFAAGISVAFCVLSLALGVCFITSTQSSITINLACPLANTANDVFLIIASLLPIAAAIFQLVLTLFCKKSALPAMLVTVLCFFANYLILFFKYNISVSAPAACAVFAILFMLIYFKGSSLALAILFFAVCPVCVFLSYKTLSIIDYKWAACFFALGMLSLALEQKIKFTSLPEIEGIEEQPDITVKVESISLSQTLDTLLQNYNNGKISKEEYEALKRETLWKV